MNSFFDTAIFHPTINQLDEINFEKRDRWKNNEKLSLYKNLCVKAKLRATVLSEKNS